MAKYDYNLIAIGGGSAGLVTSYLAASLKAKVALIEKHKMGGDCLNTGCVPSKALIKSAALLSYQSRAKEFGFKSLKIEFNFKEVMERIQKVIQKVAPHDSVLRYTKLGVECFDDEAMIRSPHEIYLKKAQRVLTTRAIVVATGARPLIPLIPGLNEISPLTSDNLWELRDLPKRLLVLGGGPIGCELAQCFRRLGSEVILIEMAPRLLPREDPEVGEAIAKKFTAEGIKVLTQTKALQFSKENGQNFLHTEGHREEFDRVLLCLGRKANTENFGLEELGVSLNENGSLKVDAYMRTTKYKNIFGCGDVAGPYQFTHMAAHQAYYAAINGLFAPLFKADYRVVPWCTFTDPEVAHVGLSESEAKEKNIPYEVTRYDIDDLDRAITDGEDHGFVKVVSVPKKDRILGVTIVAHHAGDLIAEYVLAMKHGLGLNKILGTTHIYPTMAEANKYAAGVWRRAHSPQGVLEWVKRFQTWRRN